MSWATCPSADDEVEPYIVTDSIELVQNDLVVEHQMPRGSPGAVARQHPDMRTSEKHERTERPLGSRRKNRFASAFGIGVMTPVFYILPRNSSTAMKGSSEV